MGLHEVVIVQMLQKIQCWFLWRLGLSIFIYETTMCSLPISHGVCHIPPCKAGSCGRTPSSILIFLSRKSPVWTVMKSVLCVCLIFKPDYYRIWISCVLLNYLISCMRKWGQSNVFCLVYVFAFPLTAVLLLLLCKRLPDGLWCLQHKPLCYN